jgi:glucokinase
MILAGDIGGTKSLFGLFDGEHCVVEHRLTSADFPCFDAALKAFLDSHTKHAISAACFAVAGPIADSGRQARLTNLPWSLDAAALETRFELPHVQLVNDFAAAAQGAVSAAAEQLLTIQVGAPIEKAPRLVVGAGTGLGMAIVLPASNGWKIVPSEGGHIAFAPADREQMELWQAFHSVFGRVTWERVVSGSGLEFIYRTICASNETLDASGISAQGLVAPDSPAGHALDIFLSCYGAYAGDMAMAALPRGGVYLAGGIAAKMLPAIQRGGFLRAFNAKAEHESIATKMPIHIALDPALGLHGAARLAITGA